MSEHAQPTRSPRRFHVGQSVKWNPPEGAYGPQAMQSLLRGQTGKVTKLWNELYLLADIGQRRDVLLNLDYVEAA